MWEYLKATFLIILIIAASYYVTKYVATKAAGTRGKSRDIRIKSSVTLGRDRQLIIAEIGEKAYLLGVTPQHVELVDKLELSELENEKEKEEPPAPPTANFKREFLERLCGTYRDPRK